MDVTEFRNATRAGLTRQNRWRVIVNFPSFAGGADATNKVRILARTTAIPGSNLGVIEIPWGGRVIPMPGDRAYDEFTITLLNTNDFVGRDSFERWSEGINGSQTNTGEANTDNFMRDIQLDLLDQNDKVVKSYVLHSAWPSVVATADLDMGAQDSTSETSVTLRYINLSSNTTR